MTNNRAFTNLSVRSVDDEKRVITGWATTPTIDRMQDVIEPLGCRFRNPSPMLHQHAHDAPVAIVTFEKPTPQGVRFEARFPIIDQPGPLRDRIETAYGEVRAGLVSSVSVGFRPLNFEPLPGGGVRYLEVEIFELSLVSVPANPDAMIETVKASGGRAVARDSHGRVLWTDEQAKAWGWSKPHRDDGGGRTVEQMRLGILESNLRAVAMGIDITKKPDSATVAKLLASTPEDRARGVVRVAGPKKATRVVTLPGLKKSAHVVVRLSDPPLGRRK